MYYVLHVEKQCKLHTILMVVCYELSTHNLSQTKFANFLSFQTQETWIIPTYIKIYKGAVYFRLLDTLFLALQKYLPACFSAVSFPRVNERLWPMLRSGDE